MSHYSRNKLGSASASRRRDGFTLLELLVSITIVTVILTVVILSQSKYTDGAALANLADDISARLSQAQAYGIGVVQLSYGVTDFSFSYGLTFNITSSGSNMAYLYFADQNSNGIYDGNWSCAPQPNARPSECIEKVDITRGNYIESMCVIKSDGSPCIPGQVGRVDIHFNRPNTEANISIFGITGTLMNSSTDVGVKIALKSPGGLSKTIVVYETGQISVDTMQSSGGGQSCVGTYNCSQWNGTSRSTCEDDGHNCNWNSRRRRCNGGNEQCSDLSQSQCTPVNCSWQ